MDFTLDKIHCINTGHARQIARLNCELITLHFFFGQVGQVPRGEKVGQHGQHGRILKGQVQSPPALQLTISLLCPALCGAFFVARRLQYSPQ